LRPLPDQPVESRLRGPAGHRGGGASRTAEPTLKNHAEGIDPDEIRPYARRSGGRPARARDPFPRPGPAEGPLRPVAPEPRSQRGIAPRLPGGQNHLDPFLAGISAGTLGGRPRGREKPQQQEPRAEGAAPPSPLLVAPRTPDALVPLCRGCK